MTMRRRPSRVRQTTSRPPSRGKADHPFADASRGERIQRVMADAGVAASRECERLVESGHVTVNGTPVTALPAWVDPTTDRIEVDGMPIAKPDKKTGTQKLIYVALHKPRNVISTMHDPEGRKRVIDLINLPPTTVKRLFPVGRLDADSTGLILLTNDGDLSNQLTHPRYEVPKTYEVSVKGRLTDAEIEQLQKGLLLAHRTTRGTQVKRASVSKVQLIAHERDETRGDRTRLRVTLQEGQNREIRRLFARLGHKVRRLKRTAIGPLTLKGLAVGDWRILTGAEVNMLRKICRIKSS